MSDITLKELKDILDDNELDLSARGLGGVPKALMQVPRATNIDLNSNKITFLLPEFCNMTQIVKLDLGNNKIIFLPDNFGNLVHLQHLSLYNNELENLPMSFANLKALKYLDLKKNPLEPGLLKAAGPCNLEKECKQAAVNVIHHMKQQKLALEAAVAKQEKVNQKIHAKNEEARKAAAAKNKNNKDKKKQQQQKQQEPAAPAKEEISAQMAKKDEKKQQKMDKKSEETTGWFRSVLWWTFFLLFCSWVSASVNLSYDCFKYGGGATVPGAKPFCLDLHKLKKFEKPSNKYVENTKVAYKSSYNELWKMTKLRSAQGWAEVQKATESARKSTLWKDAQKMALKAHEIIADYAFYVFTYVSNAWADLCKWYETEGHKKIGAFVDPVVVALKMTYEITKDVVLAAFEYVATFIQRSTVFLEKVLLVWQQKGFAAAIDAAFQH